MPSAGFERAIPAIKLLPTYALKRTATGKQVCYYYYCCSILFYFHAEFITEV